MHTLSVSHILLFVVYAVSLAMFWMNYYAEVSTVVHFVLVIVDSFAHDW